MSKTDLKVDEIKFKHFTAMQELGYTEQAIPTYGEAFEWFRKNFNLQHSIEPTTWGYDNLFKAYVYKNFSCEVGLDSEKYNKNYRKVENWCIKQLIKLAKKA